MFGDDMGPRDAILETLVDERATMYRLAVLARGNRDENFAPVATAYDIAAAHIGKLIESRIGASRND